MNHHKPPVYRGLEGRIDKETDKAILFSVLNKQDNKTIKQVWFPKSQLSSYGGTYDEINGTYNYILASEWILGKNLLLASSVASALIKVDRTNTYPPKPYTGVTKQDKANRLPYKDDEKPTSCEDYWTGYDGSADKDD